MKTGIVFKSTGSRYLVRTSEGELINCTIKGKFRLDDIKSTNPIAVGDNVTFTIDETDNMGVIAEIKERKNYIIRKASNLSKQSHIIASNIDQALLLVTVNYPITTNVFIDRFLASAEAYNIPVKIVFNKVDRYDAKHMATLDNMRAIYEKIGYETYTISAKMNDDLSVIVDLLKDKVSVISGHSGVGKSTLINRIQPGLNLKVAEISDIHQSGKHTTTFAEMHELNFGGYIIDTPGIRGYGLINIDKDEIYHYFKEIFKHSHDCQYSNCTHIHEPGCAVKKAIEEEEISLQRYQSYLSIYETKQEKYR
ncbi:ribosome small subunit-dependent GTPase A [Plebeiibacterium sediminum]|uniref:Small ribosomal subunit biogenesis GTPase RsgA n=1 Tax=Plebeiibacterium sediminum TaxID=2992112 RepID=A0AAE3SF00_9BACT|nr:ribosome small subunit-dependent GTPase A [Plebeiobacterium sediminum]MCW3786736.1 ribosome small subunit-dependent GTPase A [Plebeiobacterium sediminum]